MEFAQNLVTFEGYKAIAHAGGNSVIAGMADEKSKIFGLQFHPEVDLSVNGRDMLKAFLYDICEMTGLFNINDRLAQCVEYIKRTVSELIERKTSYLAVSCAFICWFLASPNRMFFLMLSLENVQLPKKVCSQLSNSN